MRKVHYEPRVPTLVHARGLLLAAVLTACGSEGTITPEPEDPEARIGVAREALAAASPTLNTFTPHFIQIDQAVVGPTAPEDANLFTGVDPADGTASYDHPGGGSDAYLDWEDFRGDLADHQLRDLNDARGRDPTSFPQSNECVSSSQVLTKMDLTYIASANNNQYAYFAVQRSGNNGDAGYYWLFTKSGPRLNPGEAPCSANQSRLVFDVQIGDILLGGHFHPNGTPLLRAFLATRNQTGVTAVSAVDFTSSLWAEDTNAIAAVAVNTTETAPGSLGAQGVNALTSSGGLKQELFAEAAVRLVLFSGGASTCGATYFGTVITRSSGAGGTSPDLKDLAGPAVFNFRGIAANPTVTSGCGRTVHYEAAVSRPDGESISGATCAWTLDSSPAVVSTSCSGDLDVAPGTHTMSVTVTDPLTGCADTRSSASFATSDSLAVSAELTSACGLSFGYAATASGGASPLRYGWTFSGPGTASPASSSSTGGVVDVTTAGTYRADLTVTDAIGCSASASAETTVSPPIALVAHASPTCGLSFDYSAEVSGGSAAGVSLQWAFTGPGTAEPASSSGANGSVLVSAAGGYTATVRATDLRSDRGDCTAAAEATVNAYPPLSVVASATPTCGPVFDYASAVSGGSPQGVAYAWTFSGPGSTTPSTSEAASGSVATTAGGIYSASLSVTDRRTDGASCTAGATVDAGAYPSLGVEIALEATCALSFSYASAVAGGTGGPLAYAWTFSGGSAPSTSDSESGSVAVASAGDYQASLTVTDIRGCSAADSRVTHPYAPLSVAVAAVSLPDACVTNQTAVTYEASVSGGSGSAALSWTGASCIGPTCTVDPPDDCASIALFVTASDPICGSARSPTKHYEKVTTVTTD